MFLPKQHNCCSRQEKKISVGQGKFHWFLISSWIPKINRMLQFKYPKCHYNKLNFVIPQFYLAIVFCVAHSKVLFANCRVRLSTSHIWISAKISERTFHMTHASRTKITHSPLFFAIHCYFYPTIYYKTLANDPNCLKYPHKNKA